MYAVLNCGNFPTDDKESPAPHDAGGEALLFDRDGNSSGFDSRLLRNIDLHDAIGVARLDRLGLRATGSSTDGVHAVSVN
jgi:hypothetical protein